MNPSSGINAFSAPQPLQASAGLPAQQAAASGMPSQQAPVPFANQQQPAARPFTQFVRHTTPTPVPSKFDFYWDEFRANYRKSKRDGSERYQQEIKTDKKAGFKLVFLSVAAGLGFTAFRRLRRTFSYLFMMTLLSYPIMEANRTFPKLTEAYNEVKAGNPTQGKETFRKAMTDSVYAIFQSLFQPLSKGMLIALVLSAPGALLRKEGGAVQGIIREVFKLLHIKPTIAPVRWLDKIAKPMTEWGNRNSNRIRQRFKLIDKIESS